MQEKLDSSERELEELRKTLADSIQAVEDKYTTVANEKAYDATLILSLKSALEEKKNEWEALKNKGKRQVSPGPPGSAYQSVFIRTDCGGNCSVVV